MVRFPEEVETYNKPKGNYKIVNLDGSEVDDDTIEKFKDNGHVVFCWTDRCVGTNTNKSQFSTVQHHVSKGSKLWVTKYIAVYDTPHSTEMVPDSMFDLKMDCVNRAREETEKTKRDTYVILGKSTLNKLQSTIKYKPSQGQKPGRYVFIW